MSTKEIVMSRLTPVYALASFLILAGALGGCAATSASRSADQPSDERITANVRTLINQHSDLGPPGSIRVQTLNHVVYLNGTVGDGLERGTAEAIALQTPGVTQVVNSLAFDH
jgi:osmotically-inducible protein OsmY